MSRYDVFSTELPIKHIWTFRASNVLEARDKAISKYRPAEEAEIVDGKPHEYSVIVHGVRRTRTIKLVEDK